MWTQWITPEGKASLEESGFKLLLNHKDFVLYINPNSEVFYELKTQDNIAIRITNCKSAFEITNFNTYCNYHPISGGFRVF